MIVIDKNKFYSETKIRVRYADTDRMGYCYYGNYPTYYEIARTEFIRDLGISYKKIEDSGYMMPIASMNIKYFKPALYDELLTVRTYYKKFHQIKADFDYEIFNQNNEIINKANTLLVFVNEKTRKPVRAPKFYLDKIKEIFSKIEQNE